MKARCGVILLAAAAALLGTGCSSTASAPGAPPGAPASATIPLLTVGTLSGNSTLNPLTTQECATDFCGLFMERLLRFSPQNTLEPELATSVTQPSPVTYVYHLRHGVTFWDGHPMTSADVVASLDYQRAPASETVTYYTNVKSIEADGPYTVVVTLKKPNSGWPFTVAYEGVIFERAFLDAHKTTLGKPGVLIEGTGPWRVDSFDPTTGIELSANPHWWGGKVPIKHITFKFFATETSEALAMRAGEIDVAFPQDGLAFKTTSGASLESWLDNNVGYFGMNIKQAPWNDVHVRRAVAYALNRANIIAANGGPGSATPVYAFLPAIDLRTIGSQSQVSVLLNSIPRYSFDLGKARREMAESAYPHGFTASMNTIQYGSFTNMDQVVAAELQKIGIALKISVIPLAKWVAQVYGPKTFGLMFTTCHSSSIDPSGMSAYLLGSAAIPSGGLNFANYDPPSVDSLLAAGVTTASPAQRLDIYGQTLKDVAVDVPYVPLYQSYAYLALSSKVTLPPLGNDSFETPWALNVRPAA
jgi:peptide/nickel transport system substrate-binding protein